MQHYICNITFATLHNFTLSYYLFENKEYRFYVKQHNYIDLEFLNSQKLGNNEVS